MRLITSLFAVAILSHIAGAASPTLTKLPYLKPLFEDIRGIASGNVLFQARDRNGTLTITRSGARVTLVKQQSSKEITTSKVEFKFPGAEWKRVIGEQKQESTTTLMLGNDSSRWRKNIPHYAQVRVKDAYPGIDIVFHSRKGTLEFDFELAAGANSKLPRFAFPGHAAQLLPDGSVRVVTRAGDLAIARPIAYQANEKIVASRLVRHGAHEFRFELGDFDRRKPLTIDPALAYLSYHGGSGKDSTDTVTVDASGNIYIAGTTASTNFQANTTIAQNTGVGGVDVYVSKFTPAGVLTFTTIMGGKDKELIADIAVDSQGSVYFCGASASSAFPLSNAIQSTNKGGISGYDVIFGKLNPAGTALVYSSYYGGNYDDLASACTIDTDGNLYLTGYTVSDNFPTTPGAFQTTNRSFFYGNGFVTKIAPAGDKAVFSTYLGGGADDTFFDIALDKNRNIYVVGTSVSTSYPTVGAYQPTNRGNGDAVLSKLNAAGSAIMFSTFLGAAGNDAAYAVEVDANDNVFVAGQTSSSAFPTTSNALKKDLSGPSDMFLMKFDASGATLQASTLFGGSRDEEPYRMVSDRTGAIYVVGTTNSSSITPVDAVQTSNNGGQDAFVLKMNNALDTVQMFTYLGGGSDDLGIAMALDAGGRILLVGAAGSSNLSTTSSAQQKTWGGDADGYLAIIDTSSAANPFTVSTTRLTFTGDVGATIPRQQFTIRATTGTPEWAIETATTPSANWLSASPRSGSGNATIDVSINSAGLAAGSYNGSVTVVNTRLGTRTVVAVQLTLGAGAGSVPDNGVVSAATFTPGAVTPGLMVTIFGNGIGPATLTTATLTQAGLVSATLGGTRVLFDGTPAPLVYVSARQVSAIVPYAVAGKTTTSMQVEYQGVKTNAVNLRVAETAPGLFTANSSGKGPGAILNEDYSVNSASNGAKAGNIVILYGTGEGITDPAGVDGQLANSVYPKPRQPVTVRIAGKDAEVLYAGAAPGMVAGVFQINVRIPADTPAGAQPVVVQIGSASSSPDVTVSVLP